MWATVLKQNERYVGRCGLYARFVDEGAVPGEAVLAFYIARDYWGRGLATEAGQAFVRFGFEELKLERIVATIDVRNEASGHILQMLGFVRTGTEIGARSFGHYELMSIDQAVESS